MCTGISSTLSVTTHTVGAGFSPLLVKQRPLVSNPDAHLISCQAKTAAVGYNTTGSSKSTVTALYLYMECIYIHALPLPPLLVFSNLAHGFPLTLLADVEFLLRLSQDRRFRGLDGLAGACARRTMRGERHTLMVESSLAESNSSWSAGLKATEFTTSSWARRARQML